MSTTVTYKGSTIATAENQTKTLLTEGKYLEDDITIVDVTSGGGGSTLITKNISANGTYNASSDSADGYSSVTVAVPASAVDSGTKNITANGNGQDVIGYAAVNVAVPNSYSAADEGKVVSSGALVAQTSDTVTVNDTYDTTLINSLTVNVSGGGGGSGYNGTFTPADASDLTFTFYAPGCTYIAFGVQNAETLGSTPMLLSFFGKAGMSYGCQTNNAGTSLAGASNAPTPSYSSDTFTVNWANVGGVKKPPKPGTTYVWGAW